MEDVSLAIVHEGYRVVRYANGLICDNLGRRRRGRPEPFPRLAWLSPGAGWLFALSRTDEHVRCTSPPEQSVQLVRLARS